MSTQYDTIGSNFNLLESLPITAIETSAVRGALPRDLSKSFILDLACGTGRFSQHLIRWGAHRVLGLDISPTMIEAARQDAVAKDMGGKLEYRVLDCSQPLPHPLLTSSDDQPFLFDVVLGAWFLNYASSADEMRLMWRNIASSLRPGSGVFVGVTPGLPFTGEEYERFGVRVERVKRVRDGWKMRVSGRFVDDEAAAGLNEGGEDEQRGREVVFENYQLEEGVYRRCAEESGMVDLEFRRPEVYEGFWEEFKGLEQGYLDGWRESPHFSICVARKA